MPAFINLIALDRTHKKIPMFPDDLWCHSTKITYEKVSTPAF